MASWILFKSPSGEVVRVKMGFSWQAFFVGSLRALLKRTWFILGALAVGYFTLVWMGQTFESSTRNIALLLALLALYFGYMLFCGIYGNRWLVASLLRRGFRQTKEEQGPKRR